MPLRPNMDPSDFVDIIKRKKWWIVYSTLVILFAATVYCILVPDLFTSTTKILIVPPAVAEGVVRSNVEMDTRERILYITQDVFSNVRLKAVANGMGLFKTGHGEMADDDKADLMKKRITIDVDKNNSNVYFLSFEYEDPKVAQEVTSRLSSLIIEENIKGREANVNETSQFLNAQLEETRKRLETQEEKIKRYKFTYGGELPQQEQSNLNRLQRMQEQIKINSDSIARLQDRKVFMETQAASLERNIRAAESMNPVDAARASGTPGATSVFAELAMKRRALEDAKQKFTAIHPSVIAAKNEVEQLEAKIAQLRKSGGKGLEPIAPDSQQTSLERTELQRLRDQIAQTDLEITAMKRENATMARTIDDIQRKVERLPQREQEIVSLTRDYENIKKSYDELQEKNLKVNISKNLEKGQKGERFQVLEPANLPTRPSSPNRLKVLAMALMLSFAAGAGGSIGFEILDPRLRGSKDFKSFFSVPVLACLPVIQDDRQMRREKTQRSLYVGGLVLILGAYAAFIGIYREKAMLIVKSIAATIGG